MRLLAVAALSFFCLLSSECTGNRKAVVVYKADGLLVNGVCVGSNPEFSIIATVAHGTRNENQLVLCVAGSCYQMEKVYENTSQDLAILIVRKLRLPVASLAAEPPPEGSAVELIYYNVGSDRKLLVEMSKFYQYSRNGTMIGYQLNDRSPFFPLWHIRRRVRFGTSGGGYFFANKLIGIQSTTVMKGLPRSSMVPSSSIRSVLQSLYDSGKLRLSTDTNGSGVMEDTPIPDIGSDSIPPARMMIDDSQASGDCKELKELYSSLKDEADSLRGRNLELLDAMQSLLKSNEGQAKEIASMNRWKPAKNSDAGEVHGSVAVESKGKLSSDSDQEPGLFERWSPVIGMVKTGLFALAAPEVALPLSGISGSLFAARFLLNWRRKRKKKSKAQSPAEKSVVDNSEPKADTQFVPYQTDAFREAYNYAIDQYGRRYPGSIGVLQTVESLINQYLSGDDLSGRD